MKQQPSPFLARFARTIGLVSVGFTLGFSGGFLLSSARTNIILANFDLPRESLELLDKYFIGGLPDSLQMQRGMTRGLLEAIDDPYTTYLDPVTHELEEQTLQGAYGGIGAFLTPSDEGWLLVPFEDGPAEQAGVREGDLLLRADGTPISAGMSESEVAATLRGVAGTVATVEIRRGADEVKIVGIFRQILPLPSASSYTHPTQPEIGVLKLTGFGTPTADEVRQNLQGLQAEGVAAIVLDLRANPGGLLDSALEVADIFLSDGIIVIEQAFDGSISEHRAAAQPEDSALPLAVIIDGGTASAAEVLAASLQGNGRAPLIGQRSFGKGSVQSIYGLSDGSSLHITTSRWYTPSGEAIGQDGLAPDVTVEGGSGSSDPSLEAALEWLNLEVKELQ